jgi:hypothetical protein
MFKLKLNEMAFCSFEHFKYLFFIGTWGCGLHKFGVELREGVNCKYMWGG